MPYLRAFRALRYDPLAVPDAGAVLCPPYDVIAPAQRETLAARDPRNAVHVELPVADHVSSWSCQEAGDRYDAAARRFTGWQREGVLRRDARPRLYPYEQVYEGPGGDRSARGFFCRLRLEEFGPGSGVRPHERTMGPPKEDRYRLLRAVGANLSPVLLLYESGEDGQTSADLLEELMSGPPETDALDDAGARHRLWATDVAKSRAASALLDLASTGPLVIADGHHRYETALRYRDERRKDEGGQPDAPHEFVLALLYDAVSGGLTVLPTHRLLSGVASAEVLLERAADLFGLERCDDPAALIAALGVTGQFGLWTRTGGALLTLDRPRVAPLLPAGTSDTLRWLDVTVLDAVLGHLVGAPADNLVTDGRLRYSKDPVDAIEQVTDGRADAAFLLAPTPISAVLEVAAAGEVMPQKSTYFQPKAATGLVFNPVLE